MPYLPLKMPPGLYRNGTDYQSKGRWYDANLVRWYERAMRPVGGWRKRVQTALEGRPRAIHAWRDNSGSRWVAVGTHSKLYAIRDSGIVYDITPDDFVVGIPDSVALTGYGRGPYGMFAYGVQRPSTIQPSPATTWSLDNWGERLVACATSDGRIFEWDLDVRAKAAPVLNAPVSNRGIVVTDERILVAIGSGIDSLRRLKWCDQENNTEWTATSVNQAGEILVETNGTLIAGRRVRGQTLVWSDVALFSLTYVGPPFIFSLQRVGQNCGLISRGAAVVVEGAAIWMSPSGFWIYDGSTRPIPCDVSDYVFGNLNVAQQAKVSGWHNSAWGEVWWHYPSAGSFELDRYVVFNYREGHWSFGRMARTCATDRGVFQLPLAMSADGYLYEHEVGFDYEGARPYAESGPFELGNGDQVMVARQLLPDENIDGTFELTFKSKFTPEGDSYSAGPYRVRADGYTDVRFSGRQVAVRFDATSIGPWRMGDFRIEAVPGGAR